MSSPKPFQHMGVGKRSRLSAYLCALILTLAAGQPAPFAASDQCGPRALSEGRPAGACSDSHLDIAPYLPSSADTIQITASGEWCDACAPKYKSHTLDGNVIRIDADAFRPGVVCAAVVMPWSFTVETGPLPTSVYTVELYIDGGRSITTTFTVQPPDAPIAGLHARANPNPANPGAPIRFEAGIAGGAGVSFAWDFGDGDSADGRMVSHVYTATGTYTATVTATNSAGAASSSVAIGVSDRLRAVYLPLITRASATMALYPQ